MATFTLTGKANDLVGDGPTRTMRGYVEPSQPVINDAATNTQHYGNKALTFDETGAWSVDLLETGDLVAAYRVVIEYVDDTPGSAARVQRVASNYFELTADTEFGSKVDVAVTAVTTETLDSIYDARDEAEAAAAAAVAVGSTNDTIIASRINDPTSATKAALTASYVPKWKAATTYATSDLTLNPSGQIVQRIAAGTSGATYDVTEAAAWTIVAAGSIQKVSATVLTAATTPTVRQITRYTAAAGALAPSLPALSGLNEGDQFGVQKTETSTNTVTFTAAGADTFDSGGTTLILRTAELRLLQVVLVSGTKFWKVVGGNTPLSSLDARFSPVTDRIVRGTPGLGVDLAVGAGVVLTSVNNYPAWYLPKSGSLIKGLVSGEFWLPNHWQTFNVIIRYLNPTTAGGNARVRYRHFTDAVGDLTNAAADFSGTYRTIALPATQWAIGETVLETNVVADPTKPINFAVWRNGPDALDTFATEFAVLSVRLERAT